MAGRAVALCQLGEKYLAKREYVDAEVYLWQALKINPGYVPALIDMGSLSAETGYLDNAVQYLKKAIDLDPMNAPAHYNLSMVYQLQGKDAEARREMILFREAEAEAASKQKGQAVTQ
jgi:tetratricopeptide (TPR) repeat protein